MNGNIASFYIAAGCVTGAKMDREGVVRAGIAVVSHINCKGNVALADSACAANVRLIPVKRQRCHFGRAKRKTRGRIVVGDAANDLALLFHHLHPRIDGETGLATVWPKDRTITVDILK